MKIKTKSKVKMWFTFCCYTASPRFSRSPSYIAEVGISPWKFIQQVSKMGDICLCDGCKALEGPHLPPRLLHSPNFHIITSLLLYSSESH